MSTSLNSRLVSYNASSAALDFAVLFWQRYLSIRASSLAVHCSAVALSTAMPRLLCIALVCDRAAHALTAAPRRGVLVGSAASVIAPPAFARDEQMLRVGQEQPLTDRDNVQFQTLSSGVKVQQLRPGDGASVGRSSTIAVEATGRLLNLNGVQFYSTKRLAGADALGGAEQVLRLGTGSVVPGLEQGLQGAKKNEIRRIIVPSNLGYSETTDLEPIPPTIEDKRALDSVLRNPRRDAALLFDVKILRVK